MPAPAKNFLPLTRRKSSPPTNRGSTEKCCCASRGCSSLRCGDWYLVPQLFPTAAREVLLCAFHPDLGRHRPSVADVLDVIDLVAAPQFVKIAGQDRIAVEIEEPAFLGHKKSLVSFRRQFGHLAESLVLGIVVRLLGAALALLVEVAQPALGNAKGFMDRIAQIGPLEFAFEAFGFVTDNQFLVARDAELDPHHGRNCAGVVLDRKSTRL